MYRSVMIALAGALVILAPSEVLARGGHGGGGGGGGGGGHGGGGHGSSAAMGVGHAGHPMGVGPGGAVGFRAMPNAFHGAHFNRHVNNRFRHRKAIFIGGDGDYWGCYPFWNGYYWVNSCGYGGY
jgi:hypothetical protein